MINPFFDGKIQTVLISASKDGFLKFWDLE